MASNRKRQQSALISNIIFSIITLFSLTVSIVLLLMNYSMRSKMSMVQKENKELSDYANTHVYTQEDIDKREEIVREEENNNERNVLLSEIKDTMDNGYSAYYLLRSLFPDDVVILSESGYDFIPITDDIRKNSYFLDNFIQDEETLDITYVDDNENVLSKKGIDVSSFNGDIDWKKVSKTDVEFAIIRAGLRGSTEGKISLDNNFEKIMNGALDNGIPVGVYFFTQAVNTDEAVEEAKFLLEAISDFDVDYPVVLDVEKLKGRTDNMSVEERTDCAIAFLDEIEKSGYKTMIYGNLNTLFMMLDLKRLEKYDKWFAYYIYPVYYPYEFTIWQYTDKGKIDGIQGDVDINICLEDYVK